MSEDVGIFIRSSKVCLLSFGQFKLFRHFIKLCFQKSNMYRVEVHVYLYTTTHLLLYLVFLDSLTKQNIKIKFLHIAF